MKLTREQLEDFYKNMDDVANHSHESEDRAIRSIRVTNRVIYTFTGLGAILAIVIFFVFVMLNKAIFHSVKSMHSITSQVKELRETMDDVTMSMRNMGNNVQYLHKMSLSVNNIATSTENISNYMQTLEKRTLELGTDTRAISYYASGINKNFSQINRSMGHISYSVNQSVKPIQQFIPLP